MTNDYEKMMKEMENAMKKAMEEANQMIAGVFDGSADDEMEEFIKQNQVPADKAKYMPIGAVLIATHGEPYQTMALTYDKSDIMQILKGGWGIKKREEGIEMLGSLLKGRHAVKFADVFKALKAGKTDKIDPNDVREYKEACAATIGAGVPPKAVESCETLMAWDLDRVGYLVRLFLNAGFIDESEAWAWMDKVAKEVKKYFKTWDEYMASLLLGRAVSFSLDAEPFQAAFEILQDKDFLKKAAISSY
jgi:hypothetical protein